VAPSFFRDLPFSTPSAENADPDVPRVAGSSRREALRLSLFDGIFAVQYSTLVGGPLLAAFLLALGASPAQIGLVAALPLLAGLVQPLGAELIRRRGGWRKPVCLAAVCTDLLLWPVSLAATFLLPPPTALVVILTVLSIQYAAESISAVAWTSWISDLVPPRLRGRYFGHRNVVTNALGAVAAAGAGFVIQWAGPHVRVAFGGLILLGMACRGVSITFLSRHPEPEPSRSPEGSFFARLRQPLEHEGFGRFITYATVWNLAVHLAAPFFTVYMIREGGIGADTVMLFTALGTAANLVGQRLWGPLCDRWGDASVLRLAGFLVAVQPLWWLFTSPSGWGPALMGGLIALGGFAWGGHLLAHGNLMMGLAPSLGKTSYFATQAALSGLFGALGPLLGGALATGLPSLLPAGGPGVTLLGVDLLSGLKGLFLVSAVLRLGAWGLFHRVPVPRRRPGRPFALIRSAVRSFNPGQGLSPLLHVFSTSREKDAS
jgi:MFS family permease